MRFIEKARRRPSEKFGPERRRRRRRRHYAAAVAALRYSAELNTQEEAGGGWASGRGRMQNSARIAACAYFRTIALREQRSHEHNTQRRNERDEETSGNGASCQSTLYSCAMLSLLPRADDDAPIISLVVRCYCFCCCCTTDSRLIGTGNLANCVSISRICANRARESKSGYASSASSPSV